MAYLWIEQTPASSRTPISDTRQRRHVQKTKKRASTIKPLPPSLRPLYRIAPPPTAWPDLLLDERYALIFFEARTAKEWSGYQDSTFWQLALGLSHTSRAVAYGLVGLSGLHQGKKGVKFARVDNCTEGVVSCLLMICYQNLTGKRSFRLLKSGLSMLDEAEGVKEIVEPLFKLLKARPCQMMDIRRSLDIVVKKKSKSEANVKMELTGVGEMYSLEPVGVTDADVESGAFQSVQYPSQLRPCTAKQSSNRLDHYKQPQPPPNLVRPRTAYQQHSKQHPQEQPVQRQPLEPSHRRPQRASQRPPPLEPPHVPLAFKTPLEARDCLEKLLRYGLEMLVLSKPLPDLNSWYTASPWLHAAALFNMKLLAGEPFDGVLDLIEVQKTSFGLDPGLIDILAAIGPTAIPHLEGLVEGDRTGVVAAKILSFGGVLKEGRQENGKLRLSFENGMKEFDFVSDGKATFGPGYAEYEEDGERLRLDLDEFWFPIPKV